MSFLTKEVLAIWYIFAVKWNERKSVSLRLSSSA